MSRHIVLMVVLITILSLVMTPTTAAATDVVDLALQGIGAGSTTEMKSRIFSLPFSVYGEEDYPRAIASLPQSIRESRISEGELLRRVESIIGPVLELHGHNDRIELFLYHDRFPRASVWMGCVLIISDALADPLHDDELAGIVAHEMAHAYFMIETIKARRRGDQQVMRIVELKCDAVAMLTLKLLGHDPADHLRGLRRVTSLTRRNGYIRPIDFWDYPTIGERAEFAQRFIRLLT
jgi:hypothetical protein